MTSSPTPRRVAERSPEGLREVALHELDGGFVDGDVGAFAHVGGEEHEAVAGGGDPGDDEPEGVAAGVDQRQTAGPGVPRSGF